MIYFYFFFFFQAEDGIRDLTVTGVQTCALPIWASKRCISTPACSTPIRSNTWRKKRAPGASCSGRISPSRSAIRSPEKSSKARPSVKRKKKASLAKRRRPCSACGPTAGARSDGARDGDFGVILSLMEETAEKVKRVVRKPGARLGLVALLACAGTGAF